MTYLLEVNDLKTYFPIYSGVFRTHTVDVKALDGVSLQLKEGEILGVVGESGCGKSTLARTILRLIQPVSGSVIYRGQDLFALSNKALKGFRQKVQVIFQNPYASLNPRKTIGDALIEPLLYHHRFDSHQNAEKWVVKTLDRVGIPQMALNRYPHEFSGGQQQRICIARAISLEPELIVCDESVSALDVSVQAQILNLLQELRRDMGLSYLFISHDLSVVRHFCDRVVVLYLGQLMEEASVAALFANPKHPYTQALLSAIPKDHPREKKQRQILKGEVPSPINPPLGCPFHTRCPVAQAECKEYPVPKHETEEQTYYCIHS